MRAIAELSIATAVVLARGCNFKERNMKYNLGRSSRWRHRSGWPTRIHEHGPAGACRTRLGAATPRRLAAVLPLVALGSAWPLQVHAQVAQPMAPLTANDIIGLGIASNNLQSAIQTYAATPSDSNAAAVTTAQGAYNAAISRVPPGNKATVSSASTAVGTWRGCRPVRPL